MYLPEPGTTKRIIKDLYTVYLPPQPPHEQIEGWELKKSDQMWRRKPLPKFYEERRPDELAIQTTEQEMVDAGTIKEVTHHDPVLENYRRQEWKKRIYGHWFMNNGTPTYMTGAHYMYLQWSKMDNQENGGYPFFYVNQLDRFYFRQLCWEDPFCHGYILIGARGFGKTYEEVAVILDSITKPPHNTHAALQSKTKPDAKDVIFKERMVPMFNGYPDFFKPQYSHGTDPEEKLIFKRPTISSKEGLKNIKFGDQFELGNTVKIYPAKEKALDGKTLREVYNDEVGKTDPKKEADVAKRARVNVRCVFRNGKKVGLFRMTSTVEEMDKGGDECYDIWQDSDPLTRDPNNQTASKMYKYFVSALETQSQFADQHGFIDEDISYRKILGSRELIKEDSLKLSQEMRKDPITEEEAFIKDQSKCIYNVFILTQRIQELKQLRPENRPGIIGRLEWTGDADESDVVWVDDPKLGYFTKWHDPLDPRGNRKYKNACTFTIDGERKKLWVPVNNEIYGGGCDPTKWVGTNDPRASRFAAHGFYKFDTTIDDGDMPVQMWRSHDLAWKYHGRCEDPDEDYENIIKAMRYWGHSIMPESNINDFNKHLHARGYDAFRIARKHFDKTVLDQKKGRTEGVKVEGVSSVPEVINAYIRVTKQYVNRHGLRCNDLALLEQLRDFDPDNTTKYDLAVSFGYTLLSLKRRDDEHDEKQEGNFIRSIFQEYNVSGHRSQPVSSGDGLPDDTDLIATEILNSMR